jgi:predicted nucleotidyltransferase
MAKLTEEGLKGLNKQLKNNTITQEEYNKKLKEYFEIEEEVNAETIKLAQSQKRVAEIMGDSLAAYEANNDILKQFKEITGDAYESTENLTQAQIEAIEIAGFQADAFIQLAKEAQKYKDEIDALGPAYKDALKKSKPFFEDIATKMGLLSKSSNKFIGKIVELGGLAKDPNGLKGLAQGFKEVFNPLNVGISILSKVAESTFKMMFAVDKAGSEFVKTTGFARNFDDLIASTNDTMRQFGVSAEDAGKAIAELRQGLSQFNTLGTETQQKLTSTVAGLAEIGVSMSDSTETITALNKAFGVSADQAADMTREIALSGDVLGKTASQITKDYNKALSTLAVYGTKSVKIFGNIASMAAAAGVEVDTLLSIADKFETFSDAAQTAAKMNAILGTSFSGMNLQMMDHDKRVEEVIRGLQSTGKAFKDLDRFTQQAIATQLGIKNAKEAQQIKFSV